MAFQDGRGQDGRGGSRVEPSFGTLDKPGAGFTPRAHEPASNLRGKVAGAIVALAAVAGFAGIAWYATTQGQKDSSTVVPLIRADNTPIKVLPAKPGGMKVPNQDKLIFMRITPSQKKPKVESLLPPPEQPSSVPGSSSSCRSVGTSSMRCEKLLDTNAKHKSTAAPSRLRRTSSAASRQALSRSGSVERLEQKIISRAR